MYSLKIILSFCVTSMLLFCQSAYCQLKVTTANDPSVLASTIAGQGVIISNAKLNCPKGATGIFDGTASNLGVSSGIIICTGNAIDAVGPNKKPGNGVDHTTTYSDPDLIKIEPKATHDACILELDVIPSCSTLACTFAFGSEEYPEFVEQINDAFGVFITGPNPAGTAYSGYNITTLPGTTTPMSINNVNDNKNANYYVNNANGTSLQYDGFTKPIKVELKVTPCATYHIKLAIADAGDGALDSGGFFSSESLSCPALSITTTYKDATCSSTNGTASVTNVTGGGGSTSYQYSWNTNPVQTTATATGLAPGTYVVTLKDNSNCYTGTAKVTIISSSSSANITAVVNTKNVSCFGLKNGVASVTTSQGNPTYTYLWNTLPAQSTATASNLSAGNYEVVVTDANGCTNGYSVSISEPAAISLTTSTVKTSCRGKDGKATVAPSGESVGFSYLWLSSPNQATQTATGLSEGNYKIIVTDTKGCTQSESVEVKSVGYPKANFSFLSEEVSILDPLVTFTNSSSGDYKYLHWNFNDPQTGINNASQLTNPFHVFSDTGRYCIRLIVNDTSGVCRDTAEKCLKVVLPFTFYAPNAFTPNSDTKNEYFAAKGINIKLFKMMIFDRWGRLVFESNDINTGWDGKSSAGSANDDAQSDVYVWKVEIEDTFKKTHTYIGHVSRLE
jgi:gliding motility-associated-like protein